MKNRPEKKIEKCNKNSTDKDLVTKKRSIRSWRRGTVSKRGPKGSKKGKKLNSTFDIFSNFKGGGAARQISFSDQILGKNKASLLGEKTVLRQLLGRKNKNKQKKIRTYKNLKNRTSYVSQGALDQLKGINEVHSDSYRLLQSGDIESNPGPEDERRQDKAAGRGMSHKSLKQMEIITYNCRGLKEYKKLKRILNTFSGITKKKPHSILLLQETHLGNEAENKIKVMWRGGFALSPGGGRLKGLHNSPR